MGGRNTLLLGLLGLLTSICFADPPTFLIEETYPDRGEFNHISNVTIDSASRGVYLTGIGLQQLYQAYAVKADSSGAAAWSRFWGTTNHMFECVWRGGEGRLVGYTTENSTHDYKVVLFSSTGSLQGQWDFGGNIRADRAYCAVLVDSVMMLIGGSVTPGDSSAADGSLVLIDGSGGVEWSRTYHESAVVRRVERDSANRNVLFGTADSVGGRNRDFWMGRTDSSGALQVSYRFGAARAEELYDAMRVDSSLSILVGTTRSFGDSTRTNIFVLATNDDGDSLWSRSFGGTENDAALCVERVADRDSGFVIGGYWSEQHLGTRNAFLLKIDQGFDSVWTMVRSDTLYASEFRDVFLDSTYRYHAAGVRSTDFPHGYYVITSIDPAAPVQHHPDPFSLLTPANDVLLFTDTLRFRWEATTDPDPGDQIAYALLVDSDTLFDNPTAYGPYQSPTALITRTEDILEGYWRVVAQDQHLNLTICTDNYRHFRKIRPDSTRSFSLLSPPNGEAITTPAAEFRWEAAVDPDSLDEQVIYCLFFMIGDSVSLIDTLSTSFAVVDFTDHPFIHQSDTVSWFVIADSDYPPMQLQSRETWTFINWNVSADERQELARDFALYPPYPNPFNASVELKFSVERDGLIDLSVYDVTGRLVTTLVSGEYAMGEHIVHWDGRDAASGVYFARLAQGNQTAVQKMLMLK